MIYLLIFATIACAYLLWTPDKASELLMEKYAQAPSKFVKIEGTRLHYRDSGDQNLRDFAATPSDELCMKCVRKSR